MLPIPRPDRSSALWQRVVEVAGRLACPDERFAEWAKAVGVDYGPLEPEAKWKLITELDALSALLYGLSPDQLSHIFKTFHQGGTIEGKPYQVRLTPVLEHYEHWKDKA